ncbi:hypothetical protein G7054_g13133 [Neopestalotiopsis clavispora]|nr:hypothetical protein G7054_g13133 [Neopestalotiopsis clavispora]
MRISWCTADRKKVKQFSHNKIQKLKARGVTCSICLEIPKQTCILLDFSIRTLTTPDSMTTVRVQVGGKELEQGVADVISRSFSTSALSSFFLRTPESTWPTNQIPFELVYDYFKDSVPKKVRLGAELSEAENFAAAAVWFPPEVTDLGEHEDDDDDESERISVFASQSKAIREKYLQGRKFWFLNLIGRAPGRTEKGVVRALIVPYLERAREAGVPAWLEAVDEHSRDIYAHFGFKVVETFNAGVGEFGPDGNFQENGLGIPVYCMLFE